MSKAPWYPRDAGCSVVGGGEPTFNYIPISSNTSPQFSSIFLHFHRPCSIFLHFPCFGLLQEWLHWKAYLLGFSRPRRVDLMWDGSRMVMFVSCDDRMNMGLCLYGGEDGGASPNPESVGYNKICQIPPWLCQPGRHHPTLIDEKGKIPSIISCHESTSLPIPTNKSSTPSIFPQTHKTEAWYGLRWNGKTFPKLSDDSHPAGKGSTAVSKRAGSYF